MPEASTERAPDVVLSIVGHAGALLRGRVPRRMTEPPR